MYGICPLPVMSRDFQSLGESWGLEPPLWRQEAHVEPFRVPSPEPPPGPSAPPPVALVPHLGRCDVSCHPHARRQEVSGQWGPLFESAWWSLAQEISHRGLERGVCWSEMFISIGPGSGHKSP